MLALRPVLVALASAVLALAAAARAQDGVAPPVEKPDFEKVDFETQIRPLFRDHCLKCHGPDKLKGDLRLDLRRFAIRGDGEDPIVPGKPDESLLIELISLPADDPDVMPGEGEKLSAEQVALLERWIAEGADWPAAGDAAIEEREARRKQRENIELPALDESEAAREKRAIEAVHALGGLAQRVAANTIAVDVNLSLLGGKADDAALAALDGLQPTLVWLNLARSAVTDAGLARLKDFPNLRRLNLANTAIGDAGLAHVASLAQLEYLNLYGTKVGDAGLVHLAGLARLEKLYLWQSAVTADAAKALHDKLPGARIDLGREAEAMLEAAAKAKAEEDARRQQAAEPFNAMCPVSGKDVDKTVFSDFEGKRVGFCCTKCKAKFDADPAAFKEKLGAAK
ncbi:MAG: hypothetical protein HZB39_08340 [Planctomycetes bacterium]|nr:hypothetical protein [Planctomycetota bacterium]